MSASSFHHGDSRPLQVFECEAIPSPESLRPGAFFQETCEWGAVTLALGPEQVAALLFDGQGLPRERVEIGDGVALCPRFDAAPRAEGDAKALPFAIVAPVRCNFDVIASALCWWTNHYGIERLTVNATPVLAADGFLAFAAALNPDGHAER